MLAGAVLAAAAEGQKAKEDDLTLVKRAVASNRVESADPQASEAKPAPRPAAEGKEPQWFKVRVVDKATGKKKVTVNLPITLVRAMGDDVPLDWPCDGDSGPRFRSSIRMSEVLAALESGQDLVQVDDERSEVRIWVE
jgi:hypothetical protein